jgi:hypothetical protein
MFGNEQSANIGGRAFWFVVVGFVSTVVAAASVNAQQNSELKAFPGPGKGPFHFQNNYTFRKSFYAQTQETYARCMRKEGNIVQYENGAPYHPSQPAPGLQYQPQPTPPQATASTTDVDNDARDLRRWRDVEAGAQELPDGLRGTAQYVVNMSAARYQIGLHYLWGKGASRDYREAARWFQKSLDTRTSTRTLEQRMSRQWLGALYAYGLGVPKDTAQARTYWADFPTYVRLMDHNLLPRSFADWMVYDWQAAKARMDADDTAKEAAATRAYRTAHPGPSATRSNSGHPGPSAARPAPSESQGPGWYACHHVLGAMGGVMGCSPW